MPLPITADPAAKKLPLYLSNLSPPMWFDPGAGPEMGAMLTPVFRFHAVETVPEPSTYGLAFAAALSVTLWRGATKLRRTIPI